MLPQDHHGSDFVPKREGAWASFAPAMAASVVLHVALVAGAVLQFANHEGIGARGGTRDAISIEIVAASALESRETVVRDAMHAPSHRTVAEDDGAIGELQHASLPAQPATIEPPPPVTVPARLPAQSVAAPDAVEAAPTTQQPDPPMQPASLPAGGVTSRSAEDTAEATARAAAAPGEVQLYSIAISQALERAKRSQVLPRRGGRVVVRFALTTDGALDAVHIAEASGDAALDEAALGLFRRAAFPAPPAGARPADLTYTVPIEFRPTSQTFR